MFIYSFKVKKSAVFTTVLAAAVVILTLVLLPVGGRAVQVMTGSGKAPKCASNEERVEWLTSLGWQVEPEPCSQLSVVIPESFDELYSQYAIMQRQSGFRLDRHKGKTAAKYSYTVLNYGDGTELAVASILQRGDKIIAADLSSARLGGFLKPMLPRTKTKMK
ncbi:MAG: DUF4830 domain-containing protein [Pseudoflavonifractor sp.]